MAERLKSDSFTTFLGSQQQHKASAQAATGKTALSLLFKLADAENHQMPVTELMSATEMTFTDFADALKSLGDSGFIALSGPKGKIAMLTAQGEDVARLARQ